MTSATMDMSRISATQSEASRVEEVATGVESQIDRDNEPDITDESHTVSPSRIAQVIGAIRDVATFAQVLRFVGASAVVASLSLFLLQGWAAGNDVNRYFLLLGQTILLTIAGFALSHLLKENKGARVFFGLSLVSVPANFAILGALALSMMKWDASVINVPAFASWTFAGTGTLLGTFGLALILLVPVSYFGLSIMARRSAGAMIVPFLIVNAALLVPVRESLYAGPLALVTFVAALFITTRLAKRDITLRTAEGRFACLMLIVPSVMILIRSAALYRADTILVMLISIIVYVTLRHIGRQMSGYAIVRAVVEPLSVFPAVVIAGCACQLTLQYLPIHYGLPVFVTVLGLLLLEMAYRSQYYGRLLWPLGASILALGFAVNVVFFTHVSTAMMCFFAGLLVTLMGYVLKQRMVMTLGAIALLCGAGHLVYLVVGFIHLFSWMSLAVFGVVTIVLSSLIDVHGARLKLRSIGWIARLNQRFDESGTDSHTETVTMQPEDTVVDSAVAVAPQASVAR